MTAWVEYPRKQAPMTGRYHRYSGHPCGKQQRMSISLAAYIKGFMEYKENSHIKGVIFNQMSPMLYPRMKKLVKNSLRWRFLDMCQR